MVDRAVDREVRRLTCVTHAPRQSGAVAAIIAVSLTPSLAGQAQTGAAAGQPPSKAQEEARKLIREVAESLRAKEAANEPAVPVKNWKPARTPWGDPDLSGVFTNSDESGIPFEKPAEFEGRRLEDVTPAELAKIQQARRDQTLDLAVRLSDDPNPQLFWWETLNARNSRVWLVQDPPDGKVPPLTAEGQRRADARAEARRLSGRGPADSYEDRSLYDQCISRGLPGSMMPAIYGSSYQIHQGPGYVAIRYEMIHETRVIPLGGGPHVGERDSHLHGRRPRPLGREHPRCRNDQLQGSDRVSGRGRRARCG